jgi:polysaccharide biosynthesis/export protein
MLNGFYLLVIAAVVTPGLLRGQEHMATKSSVNDSTEGAKAGQMTPSYIPNSQMDSRLRIGEGDLITVGVFDVPEMAQTLRVSDLGDASFHLLGSLHLAGLTTDEAGALIGRKLREENYIIDPQVSVIITEYSTQGVSVLGEVNKPGVYQVLGNRSLLDIISEAGGTTRTAGPDATVKHRDGTVITIQLTKNAEASLASDFELLPGDKLIISRASLVYVLGDVSRPGGFVMGNDGNMTVLQAVAMAGGVTMTASMNHSRLIRKNASGYTEVSVPLKKLLQGGGGDMSLQPEDIVYIPTSSAKSALYRTIPAVVGSASSAAIYRGMP